MTFSVIFAFLWQAITIDDATTAMDIAEDHVQQMMVVFPAKSEAQVIHLSIYSSINAVARFVKRSVWPTTT